MYSNMDSMATGLSWSPRLWILKQIRRLLISTFVGCANIFMLPVAKDVYKRQILKIFFREKETTLILAVCLEENLR